MKKIFCIYFLLLISCSSNFKRIKYSHFASENNKQYSEKYSFRLPKGFILKRLYAGGEVGKSDTYIYPDSAIFYVTDFGGSLNDTNINYNNYEWKKFDYFQIKKFSEKGALDINGNEKNKFFWREIIFYDLCIGYVNASEEKKLVFDKVINSFKPRIYYNLEDSINR